MALFTDPLDGCPDLVEGDTDWLHLLVESWQMVADLAFADLVLWFPVPTEGPDQHSFVALAMARPFTAQTSLHRDIVGSRVRADLKPLVGQAWTGGRPAQTAPSDFAPDSAMRVAAWPVVHQGRTRGVLTVHQDLTGQRTPSRLELTYRSGATDLLTMICRGQWPDSSDAAAGPHRGSPRVGDGLLRLDAGGMVEFASPNAVSAFRRLGNTEALEGRNLARVVTELQDEHRPVDESLPLVVTGKAAARAELEVRAVNLTLRSVPLVRGTERVGALVLLRDVSDLRRREQQLLGKDATIREIHHRVKNSLQTVGSLLRMQARRMSSAEARHGLEQAMRRVDTIALVHETLSRGMDQQVDMDDLLGRQFRLTVEVAQDTGAVSADFRGGFGMLPAEMATPLALVVNELAMNAVEHGTGPDGGQVGLEAHRGTTPSGERLDVHLWDTGAPAHRDGATAVDGSDDGAAARWAAMPEAGGGLGLEIIRALVAGDLRGTIEWRPRPRGGTEVLISAPLHG